MTDELITPESDFQVTQEREQLRPATVFKGNKLLPYSKGTKMIYSTVLDDRDLVIYRVAAFIYIHLHPRSEVIPLAWNINKFRETIIEFRETLTDEDIAEARRIKSELQQADDDTRVIAEPDNADAGKKNEEKT